MAAIIVIGNKRTPIGLIIEALEKEYGIEKLEKECGIEKLSFDIPTVPIIELSGKEKRRLRRKKKRTNNKT